MRIAVDKNSIKAVKEDGNEYIYLYSDEPLKQLLKLNLHCIRYDYCKSVDINLTDYNIDCIKRASITEKGYDKVPKKVDYKIGIIIPNYNYEHTIEKCLNSIFNQTYKNYEIVFIDDCSTDNSIDIAQATYLKYCAKELGKSNVDSEWAELPKNFKLVRLQQKRLNGGARNEGYLHLSEDVDYVWYVDSDDWLYDDKVLETINDNLLGEPDVLFIGLASCKNGIIKDKEITVDYRNKYEAIEGWSGSCGKVIKKSLATRQECLYNEGTLKEDRNQHCRICIYMDSFNILNRPVYVWNKDNSKSVTTVRTKNILWEVSTIRHYADTKQLYLEQLGKDPRIDKYLKERLDRTKSEMLSGGDKQW